MFRRLGIPLGLASLAFAVLTGPITHVHLSAIGQAPVCHAHFLSGHPAHHHPDSAALDDDDHLAGVSYVNPYVSVVVHAGPAPIELTSVGATPALAPLGVGLLATPTEHAHGPPAVSPTVLRGPPVRPTSA